MVTIPSVASAQTPEEQRALAQRDVDAGAKHFDAGQYHEAYVRLKSAASVYPSPHVRANMVRAGVKSSYPQERVESARTARALLREGKLKPEDAEHVRVALASVQGELGRVEMKGIRDEVVRVDGVLIEASTLKDPLEVLPGKHEVVIGTEHHSVDVSAGTTYVITLGESHVQVTHPAPLSPPRSKPREPKTHWPTGKKVTEGVLIGCGVGALAASGAFLLVGNGQRDDARNAGLSGDERLGARDSANFSRLLQTVFFFAGLACAAGAIAVPFVWRNETVSQASRKNVRFGAGPAGFVLAGEF